ncbi:hypothetical protein GCM10018790_77930 [Kitasatospora xanthocidica]|uniref:hypothetical protein n=1 Tax=Kitasatospora xanthocidica TaxID=83382 RepID=UPI001679E284|nr:hypothetical protein [Kitasatospora xanthocidica]GHF88975.1 hypothetical protein GCM10018790_77930 [Kitasatospora xanthocidica]
MPEPAEGAAPATRRWVWSAMEPADRQQRLTELAMWVDWLTDHHHLHRRIPRCWYRDGHEPVLEVLTALYLGWVRTYAGDPAQATAFGELAWIRELHAALPLLAAPTCDDGHLAPPPRRGPTGEALHDWLDTDPPRIAAAADHPAPAEANRLAAALHGATGPSAPSA